MVLDASTAWGPPEGGWWLENAIKQLDSSEGYPSRSGSRRQPAPMLDEYEHPQARLAGLLYTAANEFPHAGGLGVAADESDADYSRAVHLLRRIKHAWEHWDWDLDQSCPRADRTGQISVEFEDPAADEEELETILALPAPQGSGPGISEQRGAREDSGGLLSDADVCAMALQALYGYPTFLAGSARTTTVRPTALRSALHSILRCGLQRFRLLDFVQHHRRQFLAAHADAALAALVAAVAAVLRGHTALLETVTTAVSLRRQEEDASAEDRWGGASDAPGTVLELLQHTRHYRRQVRLSQQLAFLLAGR
jgi:hypothetical protein